MMCLAPISFCQVKVREELGDLEYFLDFGYRNTATAYVVARLGNHLEHALNGKVIWEL